MGNIHNILSTLNNIHNIPSTLNNINNILNILSSILSSIFNSLHSTTNGPPAIIRDGTKETEWSKEIEEVSGEQGEVAGDLDEEIITTTECEYKSHLWGHLEEIILAFTYSIPFFLFCTNWKRINNTVKLVIKT